VTEFEVGKTRLNPASRESAIILAMVTRGDSAAAHVTTASVSVVVGPPEVR